MARVKYEAGMIVEHPNRPDWGPGKILSVTNDTLAVRWRDVQVGAAAEHVKTMRVDYVPLRLATSQDDPFRGHPLPKAKAPKRAKAATAASAAVAAAASGAKAAQ
jgi:hypothetical protein